MKGYKLDRNGANGAYGTHGAFGAYGANGTYGAFGAYGANGTYGAFGAHGAHGAHGVAALFLILSLTIFCACSSDSSEEMPVTPTTSVPVEVMSCMTPFEENVATTRATGNWLPPTGYSLFGEDQSIGICFTRDGQEPMTGYFFKSLDKWRSTVELTADPDQTGIYYLYGYTPHNASLSCTISSSATPGDNSNYSNGAILTINNLPAITPEDVCVVIGAKNGKSYYQANADYEVPPLVRGDFSYDADPIPTSMSGKANYVYLLFDHIYAALRVTMKVEGTYNDLRTIKLKKLELSTMAGDVATKKKTDATVTLVKTAGTDPITSVVFTPRGDEVGSDSVYSNPEGLELTTTDSEYLCHFMPLGVSKLILTSTYDIYDKNGTTEHPEGNLIRKNAKATNTMVLKDLFTGQTEALRGRRYNVHLTIHPTYLYVLSDPDLDNPTVEVQGGS